MDAAYFGLSAATRDLLHELGFCPGADFHSCLSRDLDAFEVFSGKGHLSSALESAIWLVRTTSLPNFQLCIPVLFHVKTFVTELIETTELLRLVSR